MYLLAHLMCTTRRHRGISSKPQTIPTDYFLSLLPHLLRAPYIPAAMASEGAVRGEAAAAEEYSEAELRDIVSALSPDLSALLSEEAFDEMLADATGAADDGNLPGGARGGGDDDFEDGLDDEMAILSAAEASLREELEGLGSEFMLGAAPLGGGDDATVAPSKSVSDVVSDARGGGSLVDGAEEDVGARAGNAAPHDAAAAAAAEPPLRPRLYTHSDHAARLSLLALPSDLGMASVPVLSGEDVEEMFPPFNPNLNLYMGRTGSDDDDDSGDGERKKEEGEDAAATRPNPATPIAGGSAVDAPTANAAREDFLASTRASYREYVRPAEPQHLRKIFAGLVAPADLRPAMGPGAEDDEDDDVDESGEEDLRKSNATESPSAAMREPVPPVRTLTIRIRPDVLCGAAMDAVATALQKTGGEITKRRGGHLRGEMAACWLGRKHQASDNSEVNGYPFGARGVEGGTASAGVATPQADLSSPLSRILSPFGGRQLARTTHPEREGATFLPPTVVDVQLVTRKQSRQYERVLLIRVFRSQFYGDPDQLDTLNMDVDSMGFDLSSHGEPSDGAVSVHDWGGVMLREAGSLIQRMGRHVVGKGGSTADAPDKLTPGKGVMVSTDVVREMSGVGLPSSSAANAPHSPTRNSGSRSTGGTNYVRAFGSILASPLRLMSPQAGPSSANRQSSQLIAGDQYPDHRSAVEGVSLNLRRNFEALPSVLDVGRDTIPVLSPDDYPYIQSSWRLIREVLSELDSRTLSYPSLSTYTFGAFPSLPTLDLHYCAQLRIICRENMILSLLKMASELEGYAREAEYATANLVQILRTSFGDYGMLEPPLPQPLPLLAYPLDFEPPEQSCPPWGAKVVEALNRVAASSSKGEGSAIEPSDVAVRRAPGASASTAGERAARDAVALVAAAFQKQADDEQTARIGRKNLQVMDRLAKMQAHKRRCILALRESYGDNALASRAADELHRRIGKYGVKKRAAESREGGEGTAAALAAASAAASAAAAGLVPLVRCGIALGAATSGTCYLTAHELVFITQAIPIFGGKELTCIPLVHADLGVLEVQGAAVLNPLSAPQVRIRDLRDGQSFDFTPALVAHRFKALVDVVRDVFNEDPDTLEFSDRLSLELKYQ